MLYKYERQQDNYYRYRTNRQHNHQLFFVAFLPQGKKEPILSITEYFSLTFYL
ncbi:hypothetical protein LEP1GSC058_1709 [Leptospira fainei serovar Hurstbridge str. BUT 6]|uniref:Uncharacterized protein n=1 Tax=Leptospira fainei serovar Hurstbridge str. BUT 6 TaxID=1193011 RepID=S3UZT6_9LEPT|nr:hypothetical protein LEP1GSC058_1709 [Leptospira fainei serovar Hurstbridge str. BUT 6]